ncbi:AMP-binding protein [Clostridium sp. DJ247]|nr:AMP-binding protein [Clostridium sp. DJ247]
MSNAVTLIESLVELHINNSQNGIYLIKSENEEKFIPYNDLYTKCSYVLYNLQACGLQAGDELVLQIKDEDNESFLYVFWACLLGKIIPVPISVTYNENRIKVFKVFSQLKNPKIIIGERELENLEKFAKDNSLSREFESLRGNSINIDGIMREDNLGEIEDVKPDDIAFIQFSSGSTGDSKGVILTHKNLLTNINDIIDGFNGSNKDSMFSWMPLTHDMGLIGCHMMPLVLNINQFIMSTSLFVRHPILWLKKINKHRATITTSSNFGFRYFLDHLRDKDYPDWDLSCVRKIFNGAEPISVDIINEFLDRLKINGLKRTTMYPVYGMAEASLAVAFPPPDEEFSCVYVRRDSIGVGQEVVELKRNIDSKIAVEFVNEGYSLKHCNIRIVDDFGDVLDEGKVGYIQISGDNVTQGYYYNHEATKNAISIDGWLNTGDLGFIKNKRIVVTGRAKDIILLNGNTYYPHHIEKESEKIEGIISGRIVACGLYDERDEKEKLIVFMLFKKKIEDFVMFIKDIREVINDKIGVNVDEVIPIKSIPKTTSGKVQRFKLIEMYKNGEFEHLINKIVEILDKKAVEQCAVTKE